LGGVALRFEIEDAGGGCVLGPEVVIVRAEDGRSHVGEIPALAALERDNRAVGIATEGLARLGARPDDTVLICQGNLFDRTAAQLGEDGVQIERGQVSPEAHALAEREHLRALSRVLGYTPAMRDRGYAGLNFRLMAEVRRRPALWRQWKLSVRIPVDLQPSHTAFWKGRPPAGTRRATPPRAPRRAAPDQG
jgi:hypothetical protein